MYHKTVSYCYTQYCDIDSVLGVTHITKNLVTIMQYICIIIMRSCLENYDSSITPVVCMYIDELMCAFYRKLIETSYLHTYLHQIVSTFTFLYIRRVISKYQS